MAAARGGKPPAKGFLALAKACRAAPSARRRAAVQEKQATGPRFRATPGTPPKAGRGRAFCSVTHAPTRGLRLVDGSVFDRLLERVGRLLDDGGWRGLILRTPAPVTDRSVRPFPDGIAAAGTESGCATWQTFWTPGGDLGLGGSSAAVLKPGFRTALPGPASGWLPPP